MPYRFFLISIIIILSGYLWYTFSHDIDPNAFILLFLIILLVGVFIFSHQINNWYWNRYRPELEAKERKWLLDHLAYLINLNEADLKEFYNELAKICLYHEFIPMANYKIHEEIKWMCLGPAIRLKLFKNKNLYNHYIRTVIYPHPFISPDQDYIHISESNKEDGLIIFSADQLVQSHIDPNHYFNPSVYEWCKIYIENTLMDSDLLFDSIEKLLLNCFDHLDLTQIQSWMGQNEFSLRALHLYAYLMAEDKYGITYPELSEWFNSKLKN